jgi:hypothetical protein
MVFQPRTLNTLQADVLICALLKKVRMKNMKQILFPLLSAFLVFRSIEIMRIYATSQAETISNGESIFYPLLLNIFITGIFAFVGFAYPTNKLLPRSYYAVRFPGFLQKFSKTIGMKYFRIALLRVFWGSTKNRKKYFNGTKQGIHDFDFQTRQSEFGHLCAFVALLTVAIFMLVQGHYLDCLVTSIINFVGNFYPILLQRLHRIQIERMSKHPKWAPSKS